MIGDDLPNLVHELQDSFSRGLVGGGASLEELVAKVVGFIEAQASV